MPVPAASLPLPPGPVGLPLVGSALHFIGPFSRSPHAVLTRLAETYGPIMSFRPGMAGNFVVVSSPAAAREALVDNDAALAARFVPDVARALDHSSESLFFLPNSSPLWKQHRATVGAHMSAARSLERTRHVRDRHARGLAKSMRARSGTPVVVGEAVLGSVLDVVSNILFSEDVGDMRVQGGQLFKDLMVAVLEDWTRPNVSDAFPFLAPTDLFGSRRRVSRGLAKLYKFFDDEFIERRLGANGENHGDLLDVVLARHTMSELTRSEITKFFTDMFLATSNTSRITVEWAMALLLKHPDKMKKVQAELAASIRSKEFVEESELNKLPYLDAVVKETLRLQPPAPLLPRMVVVDGMSLGGFSVPIGTYVLVNLWAIGRDPAVWPKPEEFLPERFLGNQAADFRGLDFAYKPFGAGRRMCPGLDFATRLVPLLLASILHKIEWRLPGGMAPNKYVDLKDRYSMVLELAKPLNAVPVSMP
ncbi:hypothetical protein SETIT_2G198900v2 [Setaria italica]|uniref:Cytochrome P450 n=1 Tax=Setaria italica TaxID=4555 RepID=K3ZSX2_SETIT|nr:cytochrome P450 76M5 [Setaria italica]RCV11596.1 hypothetical protein SETIT_2G198900v2 [Setaria italica]